MPRAEAQLCPQLYLCFYQHSGQDSEGCVISWDTGKGQFAAPRDLQPSSLFLAVPLVQHSGHRAGGTAGPVATGLPGGATLSHDPHIHGMQPAAPPCPPVLLSSVWG